MLVSVVAEREINGDDAQLKLMNGFQGNGVFMASSETWGSFS